ncbi:MULTISPECIES: APC family permease [unclassified Lebetimonas]|uniref:APC family permease n=1 Tax=unclassified Lebetimonas TaxID=2648158 RepID=UPI000465DB51|nr:MULTISPECIES: APC family permease [unclassified Lebetimonas]
MKNKAFGLWSTIFLGIGSMVGAGIFIVIGEAGSIAGNIVWVSFVIGGIIAFLSGYSLAKLALRYPSRGGIVEYLVQEFNVNIFSGGMSVMFYFAELITIAAVTKSFGEYGARLFGHSSTFTINSFGLGILAFFTIVNLIGANLVAKSENIIVIIKLSVLVIFTILAFFTINTEYLSIKNTPPIINMFFAVGLTFFAYQGFSVITNTIEDMKNSKKNMLRAMLLSILIVMILYVTISITVLGNLPLKEVIKAKDYALALAAKPVLGELGFKIMAITALISTASAINATLYATTQISYTLAKNGELPKEYEYNIFHSTEGLLISVALIIPIILFLNLTEITTVAALSVLIIQGIVHLGHLRVYHRTDANKYLVFLAFFFMFLVVILTLYYNAQKDISIIWYLTGSFILAFIIEYTLRKITHRKITKQIPNIYKKFE